MAITKVNKNIDFLVDEHGNLVGSRNPKSQTSVDENYADTYLVAGKKNPVTGGIGIQVAGKELLPTLNVLTASSLKKARLALAKQQSGDAPFRIGFIGDSTDTGQSASGSTYAGNFALSVCASVAKQLSARGYTVNTASRFGDNNTTRANVASYDPRMGVIPAAWAPSTQALCGGNWQNSTTVEPLLFTPDGGFQFDKIEVTYMQNTGYDTFSIAVDGGATLLDTNGGAGALSVQKVTATCALGNHAVNIFKKNATATVCSILSIRCYNSASPAIELYNLSSAGAKASYFVDTSAVYKTGSLLGTTVLCDLWFVCLTINDNGANSGGAITDLTTYKSQLQTIIDKCRFTGDVVMRTGNPILGTGSANQAAVVAAFFEVADANSIPVIDIYGRWVDQPTALADGFITESIHPNKYGYKDIANAVTPFIVPV